MSIKLIIGEDHRIGCEGLRALFATESDMEILGHAEDALALIALAQTLSPDVVLDLEPSPPATPQQLRAAARFWQSMPDLAAVRTGNVRTITEAYAARPGWHLADLAEIFFRDLHGKTR